MKLDAPALSYGSFRALRSSATTRTGRSMNGTLFGCCAAPAWRRWTGVFAEFAAAFQFPWYFGHNWDALDECLTDLDWLRPFDRITVIILSANDVLENCGRAWRDPSLRDINATAVVEFEVVLNGGSAGATTSWETRRGEPPAGAHSPELQAGVSPFSLPRSEWMLLTPQEAFLAMIEFVWQFSHHGGLDVVQLMSDISLDSDGRTREPAVWAASIAEECSCDGCS